MLFWPVVRPYFIPRKKNKKKNYLTDANRSKTQLQPKKQFINFQVYLKIRPTLMSQIRT